jgi:hypothetical protein
MTMTAAPVLHVPDEPTVRVDAWLGALHGGRELDEVLTGDEGVVAWLWSRWRSLSSSGLTEDELARIVLDYRREVWLWLAGERTWVQCCSGLIGRITRRLAEDTSTEA